MFKSMDENCTTYISKWKLEASIGLRCLYKTVHVTEVNTKYASIKEVKITVFLKAVGGVKPSIHTGNIKDAKKEDLQNTLCRTPLGKKSGNIKNASKKNKISLQK